ncbi:MAG: phosphatase PAP2 family protein [Bryobacteraceae bacterium]
MVRFLLLAQLWFVGLAATSVSMGQAIPSSATETGTPDSPPAVVPLTVRPSTFKTFLRSERDIWTSPLRLRKKDAQWLIPFSAGLAGLIASDRHVAGALPNTPRQIRVGERFSRVGASYTLFGAAGTAYLIGRFTGNEKLRMTGRLGGEALVHALIVTQVIKQATGRQRPEDGQGDGDFFKRRVSFPSGHAMMTWSFASVVAHQYHDRKAVVVGAYSAAFAVNLGRTMARKHFMSDSMVGSVFGYWIGTYMYHRGQRQAKAESNGRKFWSAEITPHYSRASGDRGVTFAWYW